MKELKNALYESFIEKIEKNNSSNLFKILSNIEQPILVTLRQLLSDCDEFYISVAFLSMSGVMPLKVVLKELETKKINGKIIIGNMNNFTDPLAIKSLAIMKNIDIRMNMGNNMHTKGYFFRKGNMWTIIIGSSNLTLSALKLNEEWNLMINSHANGQLVEDSLHNFTNLWKKSLAIDKVIDIYSEQYYETKKLEKKYKFQLEKNKKIVPNKMQIEALKNLSFLRDNGEDKALIISATGTGKTYLSAFDVKKINPLRCLFIVHRENITREALKTFESVIHDKKMGLYTGNVKDKADYLFTTIQTINKDEFLQTFKSDHFDYIIIDEVHHSGAKSYQKVIDYFKPKFLLGMSATPERNDEYNIYELFNYNIAHEIRLKDAIENELITPFHYYGVDEVTVDGEVIDEKTKVSTKQRAINIMMKSKYYGYYGNKVRGLIFLSNTDEIYELSQELNKLGYKTVALSSKDSIQFRENSINRLEKNIGGDYLDFIITVDIFNEGIDIPCVNQVLLLRPTKSTIVYIQQLGRGLRKYNDKSHLVILDFIGNYKTNFLIPVALSGDSSYDVNYLHKFIYEGNTYVPGLCTISFEKIAQKQIFEKINTKNFKNSLIIKNDYMLLKQRLNKIPMLKDFIGQNMISPEHILNYKDTYYDVVKQIEKNDYNVKFNEDKHTYLKYISKEYSMTKRVHEILIIKYLLEKDYDIKEINNMIEKYLKISNQYNNTYNAYLHLSKKIFEKENTRIKYEPLIIDNKLDDKFKKYYNEDEEFKKYVDDLIETNLLFVAKYYKQENESPLTLYKSYTRKEAFHILNLDYNASRMVPGYVLDKESNKVLIFIRIDSSNYKNPIYDNQDIEWFSQSGRILNKSKTETLIANNKVEIELFIRKTIGEKEYYLGKAKVIEVMDTINEKDRKVIKYILRLDRKIDEQLMLYLKNTELY